MKSVSLAVLGLAWFNRTVDAKVVNAGFDAGCEGASWGARILSHLQTGRVQTYLRVIGIALVVLCSFPGVGKQRMTSFPILTLLTFVPLAGALVILVLGEVPSERNDRMARWLALGSSIVSLLMTLAVWHGFQSALGSIQFEERHGWIPSLNIEYHLGVDGLGLLMLLLSAIVVPMAIFASWRIRGKVPLYFALVLLLQAGLFGTFTALNFFHWFIFWELSLIPAFFLIKLWGGPKRGPAATQFFVYTMVGSVALLLSFLGLFLATGTFDFIDLAALARSGQIMPAIASNLSWHGMSGDRIALILFFGALLGFAVKVPLMPFHTWLPTAYAEAPTGTSMLLTGVMSKMGVYGFLRILLPIFAPQMLWMRTPLLGARRGDDCVFCFRSLCAKGSEDDLRVLVDQPPRLLPAGNFRHRRG